MIIFSIGCITCPYELLDLALIDLIPFTYEGSVSIPFFLLSQPLFS